jgi:hypothetical protein
MTKEGRGMTDDGKDQRMCCTSHLPRRRTRGVYLQGHTSILILELCTSVDLVYTTLTYKGKGNGKGG